MVSGKFVFVIGVAVTTRAASDVGDGVFLEALVDKVVAAVWDVLDGTLDDNGLADAETEEPPLLDCAVL